MTDISSSGVKSACRERRISEMLFGTTTTRLAAVCPGMNVELPVGDPRYDVGCP